MDELFAEIDKYYAAGGKVVRDEREAAEGAEWLQQIEEENAGELTPERIAAMEAKAATAEALESGTELPMAPRHASAWPSTRSASPTAGRRFTRA